MAKKIKQKILDLSLFGIVAFSGKVLARILSFITFRRVAIAALLAGIGAGQYWVWAETVFPNVLRDFTIATYAHIKAGDDIPFEADYIQSAVYDPKVMWGIVTNSEWLVEQVNDIVPYFAYEKITYVGIYPNMIAWLPYQDESSFMVAGNAGYSYAGALVILNERILPGNLWEDQRSALATVTHELIHIQLGNYITAPKDFTACERSVWVEGHTQAATVEALAAMCRYGKPVACKTFWMEIGSFARSSFRVTLKDIGLDWLYDPIANLLWRNKQEQKNVEKTNRFWDGHENGRFEIVYKYGALPWRKYVLPGLRGAELDTGIKASMPGSLSMVVIGMPFDDTRAEMGLLQYLAWISK